MKMRKILSSTNLYNLTPEVLSLIFVLGELQEWKVGHICLLLTVYAITLRLIWQSAIIVHGLGHSIAIALADRELAAISPQNILENRDMGNILKSLIPFGHLIAVTPVNSENKFNIQFPSLESGSADYIRCKAIGGIVANLIVVLSCYSYPHSFLKTSLISVNLLVIFSSLSDIQALFTGVADCFYCGNFGLIAKRLPSDENALLPSRMVEIAQQMGKETEIRGEQAGGALVIGKKEGKNVFVGKKIVNIKRHNLTRALESSFASTRSRAIKKGVKPLFPSVIGVWHYRYATSGSAPIELETHWHQWMDNREEEVWQFRNQHWQSSTRNISHAITHNGDFSNWQIFGQEVGYKKLGWWLERVLHTPNKTKGDSPKIAGVIDLLVTQGMWYPSVRLAYQQAVAKSIEAAFGRQEPSLDAPNTTPSFQELKTWAEIFRQVFVEEIIPNEEGNSIIIGRSKKKVQESDNKNLLKILTQKKHIFLRAFSQDPYFVRWTEQEMEDFIEATLRAFVENDLHRATQIFISRAKGSFGLVITSTLEESNLVLCAKGQPISVGFNCQENYMIYASDPAAVDRIIMHQPKSLRLDLDSRAGEIARVGVKDIVIYSLEKQEELTSIDIEQRWISMTKHPQLSQIKLSSPDIADPIADDINSIPQVLHEIKASWQNPQSLNRRSADYLIYLLTKKVKLLETRRKLMLEAGFNSALESMLTVDLLITGEESSFWLGEKFAQDLRIIFPLLNIVTIPANNLLSSLEYNRSHLNLGQNSLVLAITQSGQTFSTGKLIEVFDHLSSQGDIGELFILTGELSNFLNSIRGKGGLRKIDDSKYSGDDKYSNKDLDFHYRVFHRYRIFVNGSGRRTAEPNTLTVAAAIQTLTELSLYLAKQMRANYPDTEPLGMTLDSESLQVLSMMGEDFLYKNAFQIIGTDPQGKSLSSKTTRSLVRSGRYWANHITETPLAWAAHTIYILVSVGWSIPFGHSLTLVRGLSGLIFNLVGLSIQVSEYLSPLITIADILVYVFGAWLWTLVIRLCQGRELFARIGKRTITIGDISWVNQLLQAYVSKLFALSYGIASVDVHSGNPQNHFLHAFGHRVVRGSLIWLGIPDGRRGDEQKAAESASLMTGKQAIGIRNLRSGAEIIALGHNPSIADQGFNKALVLPSNNDKIYFRNDTTIQQKEQIEKLRESFFGSFERLLAGYVFFWSLAKKVASLPLLRYEYWKSQSRTKVMTTASPVEEFDFRKLFTNKSQPHSAASLFRARTKKSRSRAK